MVASSKLSNLPTGNPVVDADLFYSAQSLVSVKQTALSLATYMQTKIAGMAIGSAVVGGTAPAILYIGAGNVLAQDPSNLGWDATNKILLIEGQMALYRVPNASGDNWFDAGAGNTTLTGFNNFGTGPGALGVVTTGHDNVAVGPSALGALSTATFNLAIGANALQNLSAGIGNTAIGANALQLATNASFNFAIGSSNLSHVSTGSGNVAIGTNVGLSVNTGSFNTLIGYGTAANFDGSHNIAIGHIPFQNFSSGDQNIAIGFGAGFSLGSGFNNILIGSGGNVFPSGSNNILIGQWGGGSSSINSILALSVGSSPNIDYNYITSNIWSISRTTNPSGLHLYNTWDSASPPTNYERALLDWTPTSNIFRIASQAGGTGTVRLIAIDGFSKAGAPAAGDLPSGTYSVIDDTSGGNTWLAFNKAGTIRKVQLV